MPVVAANLRRLRGEQGRTLSELARASGIAKATLSALEAGKGNPTIETLSSLATALGVPFGDLLAGGGPEPVHVVHASEGTSVAGTANTLRPHLRLPARRPPSCTRRASPALQARGRRARAGHARARLVTQGTLRTGRSIARPTGRGRLCRLRGRRDARLRGGGARRAGIAHHAVGPAMTTFEGHTAQIVTPPTPPAAGSGAGSPSASPPRERALALHYSSNAEPAEELAAALPNAAAFGADLGDARGARPPGRRGRGRLRPVDVLVANDGRSRSRASSRSTPPPSTR